MSTASNSADARYGAGRGLPITLGMSALERCWAWRRLVPAAAVALIVFVAGAQQARAELPEAPAALPQQWGLEVDGAVLRTLDRSVLKRLRTARMTLVAASGGLSRAQRDRLAALSERWNLAVFEPMILDDAAAATSTCVAVRLSRPGGRCGISARPAVSAGGSFGQVDVVV